MAVYVDDMQVQYRRMVMCHMVADTTEELLQMADAIGVDRKWIQLKGTYKEHFDIAKTKRAAAVRCGAVEITRSELGAFLATKRKSLSQQEGNCTVPHPKEDYDESVSQD